MRKVKITNHNGVNYIVVDNEAFDWEVADLQEIEIKIKNDPLMKENFIGSVFNHLTKCFSEFVGKQMSLKDINDALERGYIDLTRGD